MILLSAGHYPAARGARFGNVWEHDLAVTWVGRIAAVVREQVPVLEVPIGSLTAKVQWMNDQLDKFPHIPVKLAAEIHFNSCGGCKARGSETLYKPGDKKSKLVAEEVQARLGMVFTPNRGVHEGWKGRDVPGQVDYEGDVMGDEVKLYFTAATWVPAVIIEVEFIHNLMTIQKLEALGCRAIADGLIAAAHQL